MTEQTNDTAAELAEAGKAELQEELKKKKRKKDKVRSAWISFAGRILAQIVGALATVVLTITVLHQYKGVDARPSKEPAASGKRSEPAVVRPADENAVAVLP